MSRFYIQYICDDIKVIITSSIINQSFHIKDSCDAERQFACIHVFRKNINATEHEKALIDVCCNVIVMLLCTSL